MKVLQLGIAGFPEEVNPISTSAGVSDASKVVQTGADGKLDPTLMPAGLGADSKSLTAGEALSAGNLVYIDSTGKALKADANSIGKAAVGFVLASAANGASVTVYFEGTNTGLTGLTPGSMYFLSDSLTGAVTLTIPTTAAHIVQRVGIALSATELSFEAGEPIKRA